MTSLLEVAQQRAQAAAARRILLSIPGRGVDLICVTLTGDQVATTGKAARKRHPNDAVLRSLSQGAALLAEATVQIVVDGEVVESEDGDPVTFKSRDQWPSGVGSAADAVRAIVGRDGDLATLAEALLTESGFGADGSALVGEGEENPT